MIYGAVNARSRLHGPTGCGHTAVRMYCQYTGNRNRRPGPAKKSKSQPRALPQVGFPYPAGRIQSRPRHPGPVRGLSVLEQVEYQLDATVRCEALEQRGAACPFTANQGF